MNAYRIETRVPENYLLHISVPTFAVGEDVEVIVLAKNILPLHTLPSTLHGMLLHYESPNDWETLQ